MIARSSLFCIVEGAYLLIFFRLSYVKSRLFFNSLLSTPPSRPALFTAEEHVATDFPELLPSFFPGLLYSQERSFSLTDCLQLKFSADILA